jgi:hypothetical protein
LTNIDLPQAVDFSASSKLAPPTGVEPIPSASKAGTLPLRQRGINWHRLSDCRVPRNQPWMAVLGLAYVSFHRETLAYCGALDSPNCKETFRVFNPVNWCVLSHRLSPVLAVYIRCRVSSKVDGILCTNVNSSRPVHAFLARCLRNWWVASVTIRVLRFKRPMLHH